MLMNIPDDIVQRLNQLAQQEDTSVEELLKHLIDEYTPKQSTGTLAALAKNALNAGLATEQEVDTAEQSRSILNTEYSDYLKSRIDSDDNGDSDGY